MAKQLKLIKNRSDIGAGTRGSDLGVDALEIAAINKKSQYFNLYDFEDVATENQSIYNKKNNSFAKRIGAVYRQCVRVANQVKVSLQQGDFPIVLSGDHSSALGTLSGVKAAHPKSRMGVIWIDAHADLHSPYTSPSGNIHGMPLAAAINDDNLNFQVNEIDRETSDTWEQMKNIEIPVQKAQPQDIIFFGVRETQEAEEGQIKNSGIKNYKVAEVRHRGLQKCIEEALTSLSDCDILYISFDVDSMDCDMISYGTGTPVPKGFDQFEIIEIINGLLKSEKVVCLEFVEINPLLDLKGNKMAETAFDILEEITKEVLKLS